MFWGWLGAAMFLVGAFALTSRHVVPAHATPVAAGVPLPRRRTTDWAVAGLLLIAAAALVVRWWPTDPGYTTTLLAALPVLLALVVIDLDEHRLPNRLTLRAAVIVAGGLVLTGFVDAHRSGTTIFDADAARRAVVGAVALGAFYLVLALLGGGSGMGLGDVKLAPSLGALMAWAGWHVWATGAFGAFLIGGLWGIVLMARGLGRSARMPFGPFMVAGALGALCVG